jgi:hypothetical protein
LASTSLNLHQSDELRHAASKSRRVGEIGAVFERFIFKPDLNPLGAENETGRAERPTSWEARSQNVEVQFVALRSEFNEREEL